MISGVSELGNERIREIVIMKKKIYSTPSVKSFAVDLGVMKITTASNTQNIPGSAPAIRKTDVF